PARPAAADGKALYARLCAACHGPSGEGTPMGKPIDAGGPDAAARIAETVRAGVRGTPMPAFAAVLSDAEIDAIARYVVAMRTPPSR
ncbi:MAG TPA: cytochrome c, partial [Vicinamibacterales bacterium]|nr:cytochrome c [Vicinamibacterales bacterium]